MEYGPQDPFELAAELFGRMTEDEFPDKLQTPIMIAEKYSRSEFNFSNGNLDQLINFLIVVGPKLDTVPARSVRLRKVLHNLQRRAPNMFTKLVIKALKCLRENVWELLTDTEGKEAGTGEE
jgi:hypothetical protein